MNPIKFNRDNDGAIKMSLDVAYVLEAMSANDRLEFLTMVSEFEPLIEAACLAVASKDDAVKIQRNPHHDMVFSNWFVEELRAKLAPLLSSAIAEELRAAINRANHHQNSHELLRSLCHIKQLDREAYGVEMCQMRGDQLAAHWRQIEQSFPEFFEKAQA